MRWRSAALALLCACNGNCRHEPTALAPSDSLRPPPGAPAAAQDAGATDATTPEAPPSDVWFSALAVDGTAAYWAASDGAIYAQEHGAKAPRVLAHVPTRAEARTASSRTARMRTSATANQAARSSTPSRSRAHTIAGGWPISVRPSPGSC